MSQKFHVFLLASTALAGSLLASAASAQSTAGQVSEVIVTGRRATLSTQGLATQVNEAKDVSVVGKEYFEKQVPSQNIGQLINLLPGVSYSTEDPGGFNSGDLRIHGFEANSSGSHIALQIDGAPFNDTGNYALYTGEYGPAETFDHITVNIGSSDVDSPSAAALGATINVTTKTPPKTFGSTLKLTGGTNNFTREWGEIDTGEVGPLGTTAWFGIENAREHNYEGRPGDNKRWDVSGKVYQPLRGTDFISLSGIYVEERQYPVFNVSQQQITDRGRFYFGDASDWVPTVARPGVADTVQPTVLPAVGLTSAVTDASYYKLFANPVNFASIRGQSKFSLFDNLTFTFDPNFFYTLANGASPGAISEKDKRLIGSSTAAGVDLNRDGDTLDTVLLYGPSNTETYRYGFTTSLLWQATPNNTFQLSYTYDFGHHRQTGEYSSIDPNTGTPQDVFSARPGLANPITTADGATFQKRNRLSIAQLNQVSLNYIGKFVDDKIHVNLGLRLPYFERNLNQFCYTTNGTGAYCDGISTASVQTALNTDTAARRAAGVSAAALTTLLGTNVTTGPGGVPNLRLPFTQKFNYNEPLPNAGVSYRPLENSLFYVSYARGFAAPKTDSLYTTAAITPVPELSDNFTGGYRFETRKLYVSISGYQTNFQHRIITTIDPNDPTNSVDRNIGGVIVKGVDLEGGWNPTHNLHVYLSAGFNDSKLLTNYTTASSALVPFQLPTKGKALVLTPDQTYGARVSYDVGPFSIGAQEKYISSRFVDDLNTAKIGGYATLNLDGRVNLPFFGGKSYLQLNILNALGRDYLSRSTTVASSQRYVDPTTGATTGPSTNFVYVGAPRTFTATLNAQF